LVRRPPTVCPASLGRLHRGLVLLAPAAGVGVLACACGDMPSSCKEGTRGTAESAYRGPKANTSPEPGGNADRNDPCDDDAARDAVENFLKVTVWPLANQLGFGGLMGACAAYTAKEVSRTVAFYVGGAFIALQVASYPWFTVELYDGDGRPVRVNLPFIKVHWDVLYGSAKLSAKERILKHYDKNGDGVLSADCFAAAGVGCLDFFARGLPGGGGFALGAYLGFRYL
jgi:uncharacterized membrane protein (Fun14 family)